MNSTARNLTYAAILLLAILLGWLIFLYQPEVPVGDSSMVPNTPSGGDFTLMSARGEVALADFRGKVVVLYFGYTACPDICPTSLSTLSAAINALSTEESAAVRGIFISVDPERDKPEQLRTYAEYFHPNLIGVTGDPAAIAEVARRYGAAYRVVPGDGALGYTVDHSADLYLIDRHGKLRGAVRHGTSPEALTARLRALLAES